MSFYLRALRHGVLRLFTLPRLSLPILITLSFTLAAVLVVVAMSSNLIFKPLPDIKDEQSLYTINRTMAVSDDMRVSIFTTKRLALLAEQYKQYGKFAGFQADESAIKVDEVAYPVSRFDASDNFMTVVGGELLVGERPSQENSQNAVWISQSLWRSAFQNNANVIGQTLQLEGQSLQVRGVVTDFSSFLSETDEKYAQQIWLYYNLAEQVSKPTQMTIDGSLQPLFRKTQQAITTSDIEDFWLQYYQQESEQLGPMKQMFESMNPESTAVLYRDSLMAEQQTMIWFLLAAVTILLIMASLNLLNLFIAHYQQREQEFATHLCMGATRNKLLVMSFLENLSTFLLAAVLGLLGAAWLIRILPIISGGNIEMLELVKIDAVTILVALVAVLTINLFFAFLSTQQFDQTQLISNLNNGNKGINAGKITMLSRILFIAQLSSAAVILTGTAMLANAAYNSLNVDLGFTPGNTLVAQVNLHNNEKALLTNAELEAQKVALDNDQDSEQKAKQRFLGTLDIKRQLSQAVQKIQPNITILQSQGEPFNFNTTISMNQDDETQKRFTFMNINIAADYVDSFGLTLLAGQNISQAQYQDLDDVALINETFAKQISTDGTLESVVGKNIASRRIIGVVADTYTIMAKNQGYPAMLYTDKSNTSTINLVMQLPEGQEFDKNAIIQAIKSAHPQVSEVKARTLTERWDEQTMPARVQFYFISALSVLTLLLAAVGSNGMAMSFTELKRFELAIRMATGASRSNLMKRTIKSFNGLLLSALVIAITLACGIYLLLQLQIPLLPAFSWQALTIFTSLLIAIVFIAIVLVVWRIINADPMRALREQ
ncbi:ABC transporter permease [Pseudoalteromonas rhizosphaerae]|uniref:ABC transporter permease n=1 Tax=Pseudoalteromonas rhizosphaerae TaxID=2518973 RepID=UPI00214925B8|nr:FtsX-like permease family protein [Pseudoalteromonas rhizosphaerae]